MTTTYNAEQMRRDEEVSAQAERVEYRFQPSRREFVQVLGAGIMVAVASSALGQGGEGGGQAGVQGGDAGGVLGEAQGGAGGGTGVLSSRFHIGKDGVITVLCGKVECGQGARAEVTQAAAEEFRVGVGQVMAVMGDTELAPNDGATVGSQTTPRTVPTIRQAAAAAREMLVGLAATSWGVPVDQVTVAGGKIRHEASKREVTYGELAGMQDVEKAFGQPGARGGTVTPVREWKVMGISTGRPNARDIVMGKMPYPSDVQRPGMLYGKILRPATYGATLSDVDVADAKKMAGVVVVRDGSFVGVAAPSTMLAEKAIDALVMSSKWKSVEQPASKDLEEFLWKNVRNVPANAFAAAPAAGVKALSATYYVPYVQHSPMEPRAAVAEWVDGKLTVWTGTQNPFAVRDELVRAFPGLAAANVRVLGSDFGGGFGGKHTGECAVEAARLAKGAGKPVSLRWTRKEEFTWAYFRPACTIQAHATLDGNGRIASWYFVDAFAGGSGNPAVQTPYAVPQGANVCQTVATAQPLRQGSYRGLGATNNIFGRECFMDELAVAAGKDPLEFRLAHLEEPRLRAVLEAAAKKFDWAAMSKKKEVNVGVGLACGMEKGSYVAACAEVVVDKEGGKIAVRRVVEAFECGAIINPSGLLSQVQGAIIQGLGPTLREEMIFEDGRMQNASFAEYRVPRFSDVPVLEVVLVDRPDLASTGAGETPIMVIAPAVANAVSRVVGARVRSMPVRVPVA